MPSILPSHASLLPFHPPLPFRGGKGCAREKGGLATGWAAFILHHTPSMCGAASPHTGAVAALREPMAVSPDRCPAAPAAFSTVITWSMPACLLQAPSSQVPQVSPGRAGELLSPQLSFSTALLWSYTHQKQAIALSGMTYSCLHQEGSTEPKRICLPRNKTFWSLCWPLRKVHWGLPNKSYKRVQPWTFKCWMTWEGVCGWMCVYLLSCENIKTEQFFCKHYLLK